MADALTITDLVAGYRPGLPILHGVSLRARAARVTVIIGPNGAGKSTLIKAIAGLVPVTSGTIAAETEITGLRPDLLARHGIAYVPQSDNIFRTLTVRENLDLVLRHVRADAPARRAGLLDQFPVLADKLGDKAGALSGGQRQFLAVAMALATAPSVILMDEPSAGLAPKAAQEVLEHARALTETGVTILLVEQNVKQALRLSDHCYILADGRNQIDGPAADLLDDPVVGQIYLGGKRVAS
ncbi:putative high-affinity branched-chain amino acid transport ATP-binding protein [Dinoroseobacter shibae DFL 12 = DSM 16493]|jgi:ABC-type branched-subunit amino acid transport system ATPase component|uniref:Putative high-affinity branched-chain amino acid transport ATP-binding protein n=1 Tax=Dinoroseobacter shibae (strain DSM 16493 / NCIMB 14021 / DFL 12) TaxID=398580 RepID=A8LP37_DINSH|nr:ABC transporter ATP-binding protein [Dinoroseobacter shibae]ABV93719.1 putative high-affinity branched-chain amino acid transport ATP-binding protein [Dinoroseobacter shibae DFL 12 = DSM 16493]URF45173.1 ABC transporter ATP-binding protein [Dinoroseobacter shibae]URF49478.1 ABC transporter ATP-binding protein [Dinoroseobacter shibae]